MQMSKKELQEASVDTRKICRKEYSVYRDFVPHNIYLHFESKKSSKTVFIFDAELNMINKISTNDIVYIVHANKHEPGFRWISGAKNCEADLFRKSTISACMDYQTIKKMYPLRNNLYIPTVFIIKNDQYERQQDRRISVILTPNKYKIDGIFSLISMYGHKYALFAFKKP